MQTATATEAKPQPAHYPTGDVMRSVIASLVDSLWDAGAHHVAVDDRGSVVFVTPHGVGQCVVASFVAGRPNAMIWRAQGDNREVHVPLDLFEAAFIAAAFPEAAVQS